MISANRSHSPICACGKHGFTILELIIAIGIIGILAVIALSLLSKTKKTAYEIIAKHDLQNFAKAENDYFLRNGTCIGDNGDSIRNDGEGASDFVLGAFKPSENICITITSGNPEDPYNTDDPYIAESKHKKSTTVFEYNFHTGVMTKR